ncbi:hypothetical protein, partial [Collinsella aerofaciens]|uniref:hypothetical protein n=1 Tax=Collinsella aerofaciens TaxID=74426 RepID=UPI0034A2A097
CWLKWVGRDWSISADYIWLKKSDANNGSNGSRNTRHCPGENEHHTGANGRRNIGVGLLDAAFGQDGCNAGKEC